jgi:predicted ATPase/DNA-binding SARP family transcriptional activator
VATLSLAFLGSFTVIYDGQVMAEFRTRSVQALLAYLAVEGTASRPHQREALAELLWPGYPSGSARKNLRQALYELGRVIPAVATEVGPPVPLTLGTRETLQINPDCCFELDTASFTRLVHEGSVEALGRAVELYRGDFLEDFSLPDSGEFESWADIWRSYFRRQVLEALDRLAAIAMHQQDYVRAESCARRQLALDDLRETAVGHLMQALAGQGQRNAALIAYDEARLRLHMELGVEPAAELSELWNQVRAGEIGTLAEDASLEVAPSTQPADTKPVYNLPTPATPFIGRHTEVEQVKSLITKDDLRLLTLSGLGGIGKTRLSIQAASEVGEAFPDGVFFVPLASVQSEDTLIPAVAKAIDFTFYGDEQPRRQLLDYLHERQLLLILDNFEHLLKASGLVGEIIANAPGVKLVVTSRIRLNMQVEQLYPVGGMRIPDVVETAAWDDPVEQAKPFSAMQLFVEAARRVQPNFALTKGNTLSVREICQLVQGMPLALELAAAWAELLSPDEIAAEITRSLNFLETNQFDMPDRQHSIRAVFESSQKLLSKAELDAFLSLCVFVGSFSRNAAQQVSEASLRMLLGLANKSWLQQTDAGRFQLHELMRQYGEEQLKVDEPAWREANNRHADYFTCFVSDQSLRMRSPEQVAGVKALAEEIDGNIKKAWDWLVSERRWNDLIGSMLLGLFHFGEICAYDLIPWLRSARLASASENTTEGRLAYAIFGTLELDYEYTDPYERLGLIWQMVNQYDLVEAMGFWFVLLALLVRQTYLTSDFDDQLEASITRLREQKLHWQLGISLYFHANRRDFVQDEAGLMEAAKIFKDMGVIYEQGMVAELLAVHNYRRRHPLAEVTNYYEQARQFFGKLKGYTSRMGMILTGLAEIYLQQGKYEQVFALYEQEKRELERMGQMRALASNEHWECLIAARYSTYEHALRLREHYLELLRKLGSQSNLAWGLFELGDVHRIFGEPEKAMDLYEQARPMFEKMNMVLALGYDQRARGDLDLAEKRYSDALAHYQKFDAYSREDYHLWSMAQSRSRIALANAYLGNIEQARLDIQSALKQTYDIREDVLALQAMLAEAVCLVQEKNLEAAIELASFLEHHPASWNETKQHAFGVLEIASRSLPEGAVQAAIERGKALDLDSIVAELANLKSNM